MSGAECDDSSSCASNFATKKGTHLTAKIRLERPGVEAHHSFALWLQAIRCEVLTPSCPECTETVEKPVGCGFSKFRQKALRLRRFGEGERLARLLGGFAD